MQKIKRFGQFPLPLGFAVIDVKTRSVMPATYKG